LLSGQANRSYLLSSDLLTKPQSICLMLADQMQTYIDARSQQDKHPLVVKINNGKTLAPNPYIAIANKAMENCIKIMNELGLTPKSRLAANKLEDASPLADFLKGWQPQ